MAVISAYGAFRLLMVLLAIWTFFAGFSLLTQGVGALSFGGGAAAERVAGAQMIVIAPVYGLIAWRREQYRHLLWLPYAAQLAIILPTFYDLVISHDGHFEDSALILIVSLIFFALLIYLWWSSHPLEHFAGFGDEDDEEEWDEEGDEEEEEEEQTPPAGPQPGAQKRPGDNPNRIMRPPPM
jgi:hypothetical protein